MLSLGIARVANVCTVSQPPVGTALLSPALAQLCNPHLPSDQGCHRRLSTPLGKPHCLPQSRLSPRPAVHQVTVLSSAVLDGSWFWVSQIITQPGWQLNRGGHSLHPRVFSKRGLKHEAWGCDNCQGGAPESSVRGWV